MKSKVKRMPLPVFGQCVRNDPFPFATFSFLAQTAEAKNEKRSEINAPTGFREFSTMAPAHLPRFLLGADRKSQKGKSEGKPMLLQDVANFFARANSHLPRVLFWRRQNKAGKEE